MDRMDEVVADGPGEPEDKPPRMPKRMIEPAKPSEFDGDRTKGHTFLNSCLLYLGFCIKDFHDDQARILWMLSFMKAGRAAVFTARIFAHTTRTGKAYFKDWKHFEEAFRQQFLPLHERTDAMNRLESHQYHQGRHSVDEYINKFEELVEKSEYVDGAAIVMKFLRGLDLAIQNRITLMLEGRPKDEAPSEWYHAARMVATTRAANEAFLAPKLVASTAVRVRVWEESIKSSVQHPQKEVETHNVWKINN
jgi:hypothetical protein